MSKPHLVVVESCEGLLEFVSSEPSRRRAARGLGLPLPELVDRLDCTTTLLDWSDWYGFEARYDSFHRWMPFPATRPTGWPIGSLDPATDLAGVTSVSIKADDPVLRRPLSEGLSPLSYGLLANSDPLFLASYILNEHLEAVHRDRPIDVVVLPMWGGLGYMPQLSRATAAGLKGVRFAVVADDTSLRRQIANGEGLWTRPAVTRRQMEDLSVALADMLICFGPRGEQTARAGNSTAPLVTVPRRIDDETLDAIAAMAEKETVERPDALILAEPLQPASGALVMLDAANLLRKRGVRPPGPITAGGLDMVLAPQKPRGFRDYWTSRGWVRELVEEGWWSWSETGRGPGAITLHPTLFGHLPDAWSDLARGELPILSPAAAEGLAGVDLPSEMLFEGEPSAEIVANGIERVLALPHREREEVRKRACRAVVAAHSGAERAKLLDTTVAMMADLMAGRLPPPSLSAAARILLDRRVGAVPVESPPAVTVSAGPKLTVAVMCYEMGELLIETVHSVWRAHVRPDELIIVDDGSRGEATLAAIRRLEKEAAHEALPLRVIRQGNRGLAGARNAALAEARGRFISFLDGDDIIEPEFYGLAIDILEMEEGLGGVAAWAICAGEGVPDGFWNAPQAELPLLLVENTVFVPLMMPTELLRDLGGYDERQRYNYEDWELPIRILADGRPIVTIPRYLQRYRVRADSLLRTMSDVQNQVMRELLMANHRETIERFGPEMAMLLENRLFQLRGEHEKLQQDAQQPAQPVRAGAAARAIARRWQSIARAVRR